MNTTTRRTMLKRSLAGAGAALAGGLNLEGVVAHALTGVADGAAEQEPVNVAAVVTIYTTNSHADVIVGKILAGYDQLGGPGPKLKLVSMYVDQQPATDLSRDLAGRYGFRLCASIDEALTLGNKQLAVGGVLNIGEHGDYPSVPETGQVMYPRRRFFDEVANTFRRTGQVAPVFNDKHLSYKWEDAKHMYDTARELEIPFLAGSSLPVAWRAPPLALEPDCEIEEAMAVGYGGLEAYGFHALELLQSMVERRRGGETGVRSVQTVQGDGIWQAEREGRWSRDLFLAALATLPRTETQGLEERLSAEAALYLIEYRDGLKGSVFMANGVAAEFAFAARLKGQERPAATWLQLQDGVPFAHFAYLLRAIEHTVLTRQAAYPVERTLLTSGVLDAAMHSVAMNGAAMQGAAMQHARLDTPHLEVVYQGVDWPFAPGEVPPPR